MTLTFMSFLEKKSDENFFSLKSDILRFLVKFQKVGGTLVLVTVTVTVKTF